MQTQLNLTTVYSSFYAWEVHLAQHTLEQEGIASYIADESMVSANWMYANAVGGVKLKVTDRDAERAIRILAGPQKPEQQNTESLNTPIGRHATKHHTLWRCICAIGTFLLLGVPLLFRPKQ